MVYLVTSHFTYIYKIRKSHDYDVLARMPLSVNELQNVFFRDAAAT